MVIVGVTMRHPRKVPHTSSCISVSGGSCLMVGAALSHTLSLALSCSPPCSLCALMLTCITDDDDPVIEHLVIFLIPPFFIFTPSLLCFLPLTFLPCHSLPFTSLHFPPLSLSYSSFISLTFSTLSFICLPLFLFQLRCITAILITMELEDTRCSSAQVTLVSYVAFMSFILSYLINIILFHLFLFFIFFTSFCSSWTCYLLKSFILIRSEKLILN